MTDYKSNLLPSVAYAAAASMFLMGCDMMPQQEEAAPITAEASPDKIPGGGGNRSVAANDQGATPMLERVAIIALLNKRTGKSQDVRINPDQSLRFGNVVIKVQACERTAPWETYPDIGAFTQLFVKERPPGTNQDVRWRKVFSGWLHKNNPAQNVVEHGLYDVWVKDCIMLFPGETSPPPSDLSAIDTSVADERNESRAAQTPTPRASAPSASPSRASPSSASGPNTAESPEVTREESVSAEPLPTVTRPSRETPAANNSAAESPTEETSEAATGFDSLPDSTPEE